MKNKKLILVLVIMLVIGFASISTTLVLNGVIGVGANKDDFNVIFTEALLDGDSTNVTISENKKNISFITKKLTTIGDSTILNYKVKNTSTQYDANVIINCTNNAEEYIELTSSFDNKDIPLVEPVKMSAQEVKSGYISAELTKPYVGEDKEIKVSCSLIVNAESKEGYSYTVNFDSDGGSSVEDKIVDYQGSYGELPTPEKEGYVFLGWYDENDQKIESETEIKEKGNKTLHAKWTPVCPYEVGKVWSFGYSGNEQPFDVECDGTYKIELWGAQGQTRYSNSYPGGKGAYTSGEIYLDARDTLYVYVGEMPTSTTGGWNGGGKGSDYTNQWGGYYYGSGGGGATDVRLANTSEKNIWNEFESLKSRIMVAAGGGGAGYYKDNSQILYTTGGSGGGLIGNQGSTTYHDKSAATGGSQTLGGNDNGDFGYGGSYVNIYGGNGGGGGYYGGGTIIAAHNPSAGGSSYISGHAGCNAISKDSIETNIVHTGQSNHYSDYIFTSTKMIAGNEVMPSHDGLSTMTGNSGNGHARITLLSLLY